MSIKEFTARASAIILITATSYGITLAAEPARPASDTPSSLQSPSADNTISERVNAALSTNNISGVLIQTDQGVVTLAGNVPSEEQRLKAARIAAAVDGVQSVDITALKVKRGA